MGLNAKSRTAEVDPVPAGSDLHHRRMRAGIYGHEVEKIANASGATPLLNVLAIDAGCDTAEESRRRYADALAQLEQKRADEQRALQQFDEGVRSGMDARLSHSEKEAP